MDTRIGVPHVIFPRVLSFASGCFFVLGVAGCASGPKVLPPSSPQMAMFQLDRYESVQRREGQDRDMTVVVAISGGGYRAANLGLGALLAMEQIPVEYDGKTSNLLREVDYFTTVSGGGFATGMYLQGLLSKPERERQDFNLAKYLEDEKKAGRDGIAAIQKTLFWRILGYALSPNSIGNRDRGDQLQDRLDRTVLQRHECTGVDSKASTCSWTLGDIFIEAHSGKPTAPYWIANATNHTNGEIFSFTPDNICARGVQWYMHRDNKTKCDNKSDLANAVPLALGMRTSSNFPIGLPTTTLGLTSDGSAKTKDNLQLSDGGQSDNLAFYSALEILYQDAGLAKAVPSEGTSTRTKRRILILIDAFNGGLHNSEPSEGSPNLLKVAARSPILPMDALRSRIKASVIRTAGRSEVDSVLQDANLAVAYINIDDEMSARAVGTTFWLNQKEQRELIAAGYRQAYATLTGTCDWPKKSVLGQEVSCPAARPNNISEADWTAGGTPTSERKIIEFNSAIVTKRRTGFNELRIRHLSTLSDAIQRLHGAIGERLREQQQQDAMTEQRAQMEANLDEFRQDRLKVARDASNAVLGMQPWLINVADFYGRIHDNAVQPEKGRPAQMAAESDVACRARRLHRELGLSGPIWRPRTTPCQFSSSLSLPDEQFDRLQAAQSEALRIETICSKSATNRSYCSYLRSFRARATLAQREYSNRIAVPPSMTKIFTPMAVDSHQPTCDLSRELVVMSAAVDSESRNPLALEDYADSELHIATATAGTAAIVDQVPSTIQEVRSRCRDLRITGGQSSKLILDAISDVQEAKSNSTCILTELASGWPHISGRAKTTAANIFKSNGVDLICGGSVTSMP